MVKTPTFTFVMPCNNAEKSIRQSLKSLLSVNYPQDKFSVIIVDDGSTDQTVKIINQYRTDKLRLIRLKKNNGPANARNVGKSKTTTDYAVFIDTETLVDKNILRQHADAATKSPRAIISGDIKFFGDKNLNSEIVERGNVFPMREGPDSDLLWAATNNLCVPKKVYQKYSFNPQFSSAAFEDIEFCNKIRGKHFKILFNSKAVAYHKSFSNLKETFARIFRYGQGMSTIIKIQPQKSLFSWELFGRIVLLISFIFAFSIAYRSKNPAYLFWPLFHFMFSSYYLLYGNYAKPMVREKGLWFSILTSIYECVLVWTYQLGIITGNIKNKNPVFLNIDPKNISENNYKESELLWFIDNIIIAFFFILLIR